MHRQAAAGLAFIASLANASCAITPVSKLDTFAQQSARHSYEAFGRGVHGANAVVLDVPFDQQASTVGCGAHVLASVVRYWRPDAQEVTGVAIMAAHPPADMSKGYSLAELVGLADAEGLQAFGVSLPERALLEELDNGRPVLVPLDLPSIWEQTRTFVDPDFAPLGAIKTLAIERVSAMSELTGLAMGSHYVLVVGYSADRFVLLDPIMGYRTISRTRLERFRRRFSDAAIVFSRGAP